MTARNDRRYIAAPDRLPRAQDDTGSMAMLMMVVLVALTLSALLIPMIITQDRSTRFTTSRVQDLDAAQAGIDVAVGAIRGAIAATGGGDSAKLPCGPLTGTVAVDPSNPAKYGPANYTVTIEYFTFDPVAEPTITTKNMACLAGYGTYDVGAASGRSTPSYARVTAIGKDGATVSGSDAARTLSSTYALRIGGVEVLYGPTGSTPLCMDAGSATPSATDSVVMKTCSSPAPARQVFVYRRDLTIQLPASISATNPNGLCLARPVNAGDPIVFKACVPFGTNPSYTQQWSYNSYGAYRASLSTSQADGTLAPLCMNVAAQTLPQTVTLASCNYTNSDPKQTWPVSAMVGAGGATQPQWVNSKEFGQCLNVTPRDPTIDHLIDYPCAQNPYAPKVLWNEKFSAPAIPTGQTSVTGSLSTVDTDTGPNSGKTFCLTSPGVSGGYVTVGGTGPSGTRVANACTPGTPTDPQKWTIYGGDKSLLYSKRYTIQDSTSPVPLCLGLGAPYPSETPSSIVVVTCTGATDQKWNANSTLSPSALQNTKEN